MDSLLTDDDKFKLFVKALIQHDIKCVQESGYVNKIINSNTLARPLHVVVSNGSIKMVKCLLKAGANVNLKTINGETPLHLAIMHRSYEIVWYLIRYGADVNAAKECDNNDMRDVPSTSANVKQTEKLETPLYLAVKYNQTRILRLLLCNLETVVNVPSSRKNPLHCAIRKGCLTHMNELMRFEANCNVIEDGEYPLHIIARENMLFIAKELFNYKDIDVNVRSSSGMTPIQVAAQFGNRDMIELLFVRNADISQRTHLSTEVDLFISSLTNNTKDLKYILPNLDISKVLYEELLQVTIRHGSVGVAKCLLESGCKTDCQTRDGMPILIYALELKQPEIAVLLLEHGADGDVEYMTKLNASNHKLLTPLYLAIEYGMSDVTEALLRRGVILCNSRNSRFQGCGINRICSLTSGLESKALLKYFHLRPPFPEHEPEPMCLVGVQECIFTFNSVMVFPRLTLYQLLTKDLNQLVPYFRGNHTKSLPLEVTNLFIGFSAYRLFKSLTNSQFNNAKTRAYLRQIGDESLYNFFGKNGLPALVADQILEMLSNADIINILNANNKCPIYRSEINAILLIE